MVTVVGTHQYSKLKAYPQKVTFALSLTDSGECITCGDNRHGQLGYRRERECLEGRERQPAVVPGLAGKEVERVACGDLFTIACCKGMIWSLFYVKNNRFQCVKNNSFFFNVTCRQQCNLCTKFFMYLTSCNVTSKHRYKLQT